MCVRIRMNSTTSLRRWCWTKASGPITSFSTGGRKDVDAALAPMLQPFAQWKSSEVTNDATVGTDNFDFMMEGVPTLLPNQVEANYLVNYHATSDTFDKVDFAQLKKNEAMAAELVFELANAPQRIGPRYTPRPNRSHISGNPSRRADERLWDVGGLGERDKGKETVSSDESRRSRSKRESGYQQLRAASGTWPRLDCDLHILPRRTRNRRSRSMEKSDSRPRFNAETSAGQSRAPRLPDLIQAPLAQDKNDSVRQLGFDQQFLRVGQP